MKTLYLIIFSLLTSISLHAQVCFRYDAAGNRINRSSTICSVTQEPPGDNPTDATEGFRQIITNETDESNGLISLKVYPNPTSNHIYLETAGFPTDAKVIITSINGSVVFQGNLGNGDFDLSSFKSGLYFIRVIYGSQQKKVRIEKID